MENHKRIVCLHFHIFKNAGTTIEWILEKNFPKNAVRMDLERLRGILPMNVVIDYLRRHQNVEAFSSHQISFPLSRVEEFLFIPILFIRHPIDRAVSVYYFNRTRSDIVTEAVTQARKLSLSDYIQWHLKHEHNITMKNFQVFFLSRDENFQPHSLDNCNLALERAKSCSILGVADKFDESMVLAEEVLRPYFKNIDMSYVKQKISSGRELSLTDRLESTKLEISGSVMDELVKHNRLDLELYSLVNKEVDSRLKRIDGLERKLINFLERCKKVNPRLVGDFETRIRLSNDHLRNDTSGYRK